ncbi:L,D-transpeptidase, partial [Jatrophihabitans sp.]|uniref:L,D-transpeptidase n=1 Tax=Jatrophihabitans sp. TaxID=1932789 RepID=UPI0030C6612F|nr:ErfK/YbiS/YcfS/YnhG family protein [Jatrophihabitans sp.]
RPHSRRRTAVRILAPLAASAAVVAMAVGISLHNGSPSHRAPIAAGHTSGPTRFPSSTPPTTPAPTTLPAGAKPVHVALAMKDGSQVGVGMPVVAYFSRDITNGVALQQATTVKVNGKSVEAAWYFEAGTVQPGYPMQGHLRMDAYWPAHAAIQVSVPAAGLSAGTGLAFDDSVSLTFTTGAKTVATVDDKTHKLTVTSDGKPLGVFPVSLGSPSTPTSSGTKVIMAKGAAICMTGPGYHDCGVKYTQRLTADGEYLHAAPWNVKNIAAGIDSSNGCTNLTTADAKRLYGVMEIGDIVRYPNATGPKMSPTDGLGDWNVPWPKWLTGGLAPTR